MDEARPAASGHAESEGEGPAALAARLGHNFADPALLREALTHQSAAPSGEGGVPNYQRLEFLGDRVLGLVIAELLLKQFPDEPEGDLARRLAALVRREALAEVAVDLDLGRYLILARAEAEAGAAKNPTLLADACEAVIGALYLDGGLDLAARFVTEHWRARIAAAPDPPQDSKTALQEWAQGRGLPLPVYRETGREGPDHQPVFRVEVRVEGAEPAEGSGRSKRLAEQAAAKALLALVTGRSS